MSAESPPVTERTPESKVRANTLWFRTAYNAAATMFHLTYVAPKAEAAELERAQSIARALVGSLALTLMDLDRKLDQHLPRRHRRSALKDRADMEVRRHFLLNLRNPSIVLLAGVVARSRNGKNPHEEIPRPAGDAIPNERLLEIEENLTSLSDRDLIVGLGDPVRLSYRTRYNLACYYTELKEDGSAIEELTYALASPSLKQWAAKDPSLKSLRQLAGFKKLVGTTRPHVVDTTSPRARRGRRTNKPA
jgi:hypothetical protein